MLMSWIETGLEAKTAGLRCSLFLEFGSLVGAGFCDVLPKSILLRLATTL